MLLSGVVIDFNKMHQSFSSFHQTPVIGDVMTSRWAYEAQAVNFVKNNQYRKDIFDVEQKKSNLRFKTYYFIPELDVYLQKYQLHIQENELTKADVLRPIISEGFSSLTNQGKPNPRVMLIRDSLTFSHLNHSQIEFLKHILSAYHLDSKTAFNHASILLDSTYTHIENQLGHDYLVAKRNKYSNRKLNDIVMDKYSNHKIYIRNSNILQGDEPIFRPPAQNNGRAHFYASFKLVNGVRIDTLIFNIAMIWIFNILLMVMLYFDVLRKSLTFVHHWRLRQQARIGQNIMSASHGLGHKHEHTHLPNQKGNSIQ